MSCAVDEDPALGRLFEAGEHAQQRGLAAARSAEQREEFALVDVERYIVDGGKWTELLGDCVDADEGLGGGSSQTVWSPSRRFLRGHRPDAYLCLPE